MYRPHEGIGNLVSAWIRARPGWALPRNPSQEPGTFTRPVVDQSPHLPRTARGRASCGLGDSCELMETLPELPR